ncbi:MAG: TMEM175 family protein [Lactobacillus sp.]|jgi:uncharacterized membrane protein|nr:TMEM175 family protein [Lactobacillus sp.]
MNKSRVEAFTDAVLAIILTIMILEFKTPESMKLAAILHQVPYLISYAIGYLFIGVAWYNHHYMFAKTHFVTKKIYWANNLWLFSTSFLPVATAWVGENLRAQGPQIFYAICYAFWAFAYMLLSYLIAQVNAANGHEDVAQSIHAMMIYRFLSHWQTASLHVIVTVAVLIFYPAIQLFLVAAEIIFIGARSNSDSDKLF